MVTVLKQKRNEKGYITKMLKVGIMYLVTKSHQNKAGYTTKYGGSSKEKAEKAYSEQK